MWQVGDETGPGGGVRMARRFSMVAAGLAAFVALLLLATACGGGGMFDMGEMDEQMHG